MWTWLGWCVWPVLASSIDRDEAQAMVDALVPEVEALTGRSFVAPPRVGIASRARLRPALIGPPVVILPPDHPAPAWSPPEAEVRAAEHLLDNALAIYAPRKERIYVVKEGIEELFVEIGLEPEALRPLVRCVLVHELVHVLQHQHGVDAPTDPDEADGALALREGHAVWVASEHCASEEGEAIASLMDTVQGIELLASLSEDDAAARYGWGRLLAGALQEEGLIWAAMSAPPPRWSDVVADLAPDPAPQWREPTALAGALRRIGARPSGREVPQPLTPASLSAFLGVRPGVDPIPRASGGWLLEAELADAAVVALHFEEPGTPAELIAQRRRAIRTGQGALVVFFPSTGALTSKITVRSVGSLLRDDDVTEAIRIRVRTSRGAAYTEHWVATERRLLISFLSGSQLDPGEAPAALLALLGELPGARDEPPQLEALAPWMDAVRAASARISPTSSWQYRLQQASDGIDAGRPEPCTAAFADVLVDGAVPDPAPYAVAAFRCAAARGEPSLARAAMGRLDELEPGPAVFLSWHLIDAGQPGQALAILDRVAEPADRAELDQARLVALVHLRRWPEVVALASEGEAPPQARAHAASALFLAGRRAQGRAILAEVCPQLPEDDRRQCAAFFER